MTPSASHLRAIGFALLGFAIWVLADTCMKLAGEADLPPYEVVGFLGFFGSLSLIAWHAPRKRLHKLWPKKPSHQLVRALLSFCICALNAVALKHLPLTLFYIAVFTSPMVIALFAAVLLREHLTWKEIAAIVAGFVGVVIAVDPWNHFGGGDWIGYAAATGAVLFFAVTTIITRVTAQTETYASLAFFTAMIECLLGFGMTLWHGTPVHLAVLGVLALMGFFNIMGNICNFAALHYASAATVEQYHYTQLVTGALLGYVIWHEIPTVPMITGAAIIIVSGLYVAATHKASGQPAPLLQNETP